MTDAFDRYAEPADRLKWARRRAGYDEASQAGRAFGWKLPTYLAHENGSRGLPFKRAVQYAKAFRVSAAWLMTGEGSPEGGVSTRENHSETEVYQPKVNDYGGISQVPLIGDAAPGVWQEVIAEDEMSYVYAADSQGNSRPDFAVTLVGPSMDRRFPEGTVVICTAADGPAGPLRSGDTVVAERHDDPLVERRVAIYKRDPAGQEWLWPQSSHRDHQAPLPMNSDGASDVRVIGIVLNVVNAVPRGED
ncbi:XRE family transcriptional regulator [Fodinicurvata sp. EGI_FJ10296]|uniref:helix-turn-helix domain-containing protein n=1 Tax=Fodinicurvata sp. EGI_FJ10296 TaxID=3231908 RepID=UPI003456EFDC